MNTSPGVGKYNEEISLLRKRSPSYKMGEKTHSEFERILRRECETRPGPANYTPFRSSLTNISYSMCGKNSKEEIHNKMLTNRMRDSIDALNRQPGPGDYNPIL